jgi:hypothetical protein
MKNKLTLIAFNLSLLTTSAAMAKEPNRSEDGFAKHKAQILTNLNQEKGIIDSEIACINSAQGKEGLGKCHEQRRAAMEKLEQQRLADRKAQLQSEIQKIDAKSAKVGQRPANTSSNNNESSQ